MLGEYVVSKQEVALGATTQEVENDAWQVLLSWVVSGGDASFRGVTPKNSFDWTAGTWGALELVARYSELSIDDEAFDSGPAQSDFVGEQSERHRYRASTGI